MTRRNRRRELALDLLRRVALQDSRLRLDHLPERPEADAVAVRERAALAPASQARRAERRLRCSSRDEARLADAGDAQDRDELRRTFGGGPREPLVQGGELPLAADERRAMAREVDAGLRQRADRLPDPDRRALARCRDRRSASDTRSRPWSRGTSARRRGRRPRGRRACRRAAVLTTSPTAIGSPSDSDAAERDEGLAGRNGDARTAGRRRARSSQSRMAERCADRSLGIVLVRSRGAEHRHDRRRR